MTPDFHKHLVQYLATRRPISFLTFKEYQPNNKKEARMPEI